MTSPDKYKVGNAAITEAFLKHHPQLAEAIAVVNSVLERAQFPINSFHDLVEALGGAEAEVQFGPQTRRIADFESQVPAYYFPIVNENDLVAKVADLARRPPSAVMTPPAASAGVQPTAPPSVSADELRARSQFTPGVAGVGGIKG